MEILDKNIQQINKKWWVKKRLKYNTGLLISGIIAFILYAILGSALIEHYEDFEITLFTITFQGVGYLLMMFIANLFYNFGYIADKVFNKHNDEQFRKRLFNFGFWFSFGLPFLIPINIVFKALI
jgi:sterol desaturase/sphingolipid hydroxylase (fatty acid hydroxylase superfamily)